MGAYTKATLSAPRKALVETCQRVNWGQIRCAVRNGEPQLEQAKITRHIRLGSQETSRAELALADFQLRAPVLALFELFDELGDATVELKIRNGLPWDVLVDGLDEGGARDE